MKILLTVASLDRNFGGPVVKARNLARSMRGMGHTVTIAGSGESGHDGVMAIKPTFRFHSTPVPLAVGSLKRAVGDSDLVHIIGFRDPVGMAAAHFASRAKLPYVLEPAGMHRRRIRSHKLKTLFDGTIGRQIVANAKAVIATSSLERRELIEDGVEEARVVVRPNGLDFGDHHAQPGGMRRRFEIPEQAPLVIHLGRISRKKGLVPLIGAVSSMEGVWLLIAGPDDRDGTLQTITRQAELVEKRIIIEPEGLWEEDKWAAYAEANVFCLYSETENFGNAAGEAAAAGLPIAITDACGIAEWLDPEASRVVRFGDQSSLVASLRELLHPSAKRAAEVAAPALREALDWKSIAKKQIEIYESALNLEAST